MFCKFRRKTKQSDGRNQVDEVSELLQQVHCDEDVCRDQGRALLDEGRRTTLKKSLVRRDEGSVHHNEAIRRDKGCVRHDEVIHHDKGCVHYEKVEDAK